MPGPSISTHVLDVERGEPTRGVRVELFRAGELVSTAETDEDGRIPELAADLVPGTYRLVFHPATEFFSRVELELTLTDGHYHVPLLVAPYSCTTYRGS
jgi:5-hydroxyisourate hydrolase